MTQTPNPHDWENSDKSLIIKEGKKHTDKVAS